MTELVQPTEAGFSTNLFLNHPNMGRVQFTFRGATSQDWGNVLEDLGRFLKYMQDKGWMFDGQKPAPAPEVVPSVEPTRVPVDDGGNDLPEVKHFTAEKLSVSMNDGKYSFKVMGGHFSKWGVTVYEEVLKSANLDIREGQPVPDINGWTADYIEYEKDGKKRMKVTRLLPPK